MDHRHPPPGAGLPGPHRAGHRPCRRGRRSGRGHPQPPGQERQGRRGGAEEQSRALAGVLAASRGTSVPPALFRGAAKVFARNPPPEEYLAAFWELFPPGRWTKSDGGPWLRMLAACLAGDVPVKVPPRGMPFSFLEGPRLRHLFAHPVLGPRAEHQVSRYHHDPHRVVRNTIGLFPDVPEVVPLVRSRAGRLMAEIGGAGLPRAADGLRTLDSLLDRAAITAFEGIEEDLAAVDPVGPLLRALRCGLPEELGWPAFDAAVAELGGTDAVLRVCPSWPVLTLVGRDRAIAVDHTGRVDELSLPVEEETPVVRYLDGRFLVASQGSGPRSVHWSDRPGEAFVPDWDWATASWAEESSTFSRSERTGTGSCPTRRGAGTPGR